ncbi:ABC transporter ATP-binding protein [Candidatus Marsarchaeota G1 archaeon BE_D]|jgi:ABC-type multidrug transport system, ATPase component|uniref:ABC transporter ATP-binding protein n=1 Tax=Candidatus Marsarchaeota G1 archaeon BE_D TaxID=1978156 RepID=A0A2R6AHS7_9ARCH|nr:MAG: ABC transporter ATP-binding protein [Candidatus Marsarchaeota G1 archaeon BE_D]
MLKLESVTKRYPISEKPAIENVSFEVKDGEVVGFVGLNGAGKTTTIRICAGVALPTSGSVFVDGFDIVKQKVDASKRLGWVPEIPVFEPNAKAISLLKYFAGFYGLSGEQAEKKCKELLERVGLSGNEQKKINAFSQGMKKRFALAASLISEPQNFLFDEVLNGLDPEGIQFFRRLTMDLRREGKAVLFSSHILSEVQGLADKVVFIHRGKILRITSATELSGLGQALRIVLKSDVKHALDLLSSFGNAEILEQRVDGTLMIVLKRFKAEPSEVNAALVNSGVQVKEISLQSMGLEEYFFSLIREAEKA